jgi:uncharacterized low-complexity protein
MSNKTFIKPLAIALGATFVTSLAGTTIANAAENPFSMTELPSGYMVADKAEGKCGEGKCGEGKCGSGEQKAKEGKCGEGKMEKEGKCGEGKCGSGEQKAKEGKCGEGKCGGK